jgi:tetratricopeptide (TPR) repeat protein
MVAYEMATMMAGRNDDLLAALALLPEVTAAPGAAGWMALVFLAGVFIFDNLGRFSQATALEQPFLALARERGDQEPLARFWWNISVAQRAPYAHDDPWNALVHSNAIQPIFDLIGGDLIFVYMQLMRGINEWYLGAFAPAAHMLDAASGTDTALGEQSSLRRFCLSWLYADRGALDQARDLAIQLRESSRAHHDRLGEGRARWVLAEVLRRIGDLEAAEREIQVALAMAVPLEHPGVLATLSALRLAQGRAAEAITAAEDAMARCAALGGCGLFREAFVRLVHAEALHATGALDAALHAIAGARAHLVAIADKIPDPAYHASFLENVPENARTLALAAAWLGDPAPPRPAGA